MARQIHDKLYRISIDLEHTFTFVHAKNEKDLMEFLSEKFSQNHKICSVQELHSDGTYSTIPVMPDPTYSETPHVPADHSPLDNRSTASLKAFLLCEEYEGGDGIREFSILACADNEESVQKLMQAKVVKDEYGMFARNGVSDWSFTHYTSNFVDGFVSYYILTQDILSPEKVTERLNSDTYNALPHYPDNIREILKEAILAVTSEEAIPHIDTDIAAEYFLSNKAFEAEIRDEFWHMPDHIKDSHRNRAFHICVDFIWDSLNEQCLSFEDMITDKSKPESKEKRTSLDEKIASASLRTSNFFSQDIPAGKGMIRYE